jgi:MSHA biogenesis protein MshQ
MPQAKRIIKPWSVPILVLFACFVFFPKISHAACSTLYKGKATINEVKAGTNNNDLYFIEVKLLDTSITKTVYDTWTLSFCNADGMCKNNVSLSASDDTSPPYIITNNSSIPSFDYINLGIDQGSQTNGMDIILKDGSGNTIDYLSVNNVNSLQDNCTLLMDWTYPGSISTQNITRIPDGTGEWNSAPGQSGGDSEGDTNDVPLGDGTAPPRITITGDTATEGYPLTFTVTVLDAVNYDASIRYQTLAGTAIDGTDYTAVGGTITFSAGTLAGTAAEPITVNTIAAPSGDVYLWCFIDQAVNATIVNHYAQGNILASSPAGPNHFDIDHDGAGINCLAKPITVTAEAADGTTVTSYTGTITLDTQTDQGTWTLATGSGIFTGATADGLATYAYDTADLGIATFYLDYQEGASPINIFVTDGTANDDDLEGNITFSPSGFTVTASALANPPPNPINDPMTAQTAGTAFTMHIAAYGQTPTDSICGIIEAYTGAKDIKFWSTYDDPGTGNIQVAITATTTTAIATSEAGSAPQPVTFTNGQASVSAKYEDVGQIQISMKDDTVAEPEPPSGIAGASNLFVVKPAGFVLSDIKQTAAPNLGNPAAVDASGAKFVKAGEAFTVTVTALTTSGKTKADAGTAIDCATTPADCTPNYGKETTPAGVILTHTLVAPLVSLGGVSGTLGNPAVFSPFTNGVAMGTTFTWDEVGIITLTPSIGDGDYLGAGDVIGTMTGNVGRFYPDHLELSSSGITPFCNGFTYMGQNSLGLNFTLEAQNSSNNKTVNYFGSFAKAVITLGAEDNNDGTNLITRLLSSLPTPGWASGSYVFATTSAVFDRAAAPNGPDGPFDMLDIGFTISNNEAPFTGVFDMNPETITNCGTLGTCTSKKIGTTTMRFGRLNISSSYGPETENLGLPLTAQYYDGTDFLTNNLDTCTTVTLGFSNFTDNLAVGDTCVLSTGTSVPTANLSGEDCPTTAPLYEQFNEPPTAGDFNLNLLAPGLTNEGSLLVTVSEEASSGAWLKFDWDGDTIYDNDPTATATFGIYRGNDRIINWREIVR